MRPLGLILAVLSAALVVSYPEYALAAAFSNSNVPGDILLLAILLAVLAVLVGIAEEYYAGADVDDVGKFIQGLSLATIAAARETRGGPLSPPSAVPTCRSCGAVVSTDARFCSGCGRPVSAQS